MARVYVGLGSNLGDRGVTLRRALDLLRGDEEVELVAVSSFRDTEPWGPVSQPRFLNAVAALETALAPRAVLERLLGIERSLGRSRSAQRFGPRTIDLDLLLYGDEIVDEPGLAVPHPRLHERRFVLEPLAELEPALVVPGRGTVASLLARLE